MELLLRQPLSVLLDRQVLSLELVRLDTPRPVEWMRVAHSPIPELLALSVLAPLLLVGVHLVLALLVSTLLSEPLPVVCLAPLVP